jgi:dTDP-glucose 4,6-dehydratase
MHYLITGGCGFIGCNFIRGLLADKPDARVTNVDALTYAGSEANLADVAAENSERYAFVRADIGDAAAMAALFEENAFDAVVNFAAESHVDRSIVSPQDFVHTNIVGAATLLQLARECKVGRFLQVSTDEVYGSLGPEGLFTEETPIRPSSPYSASKAAADLLVLAAHHTYGQDVLVTRCSNNYGPYQFPEKLIPLMITKALAREPLPVYGDGSNVRDWIHVEDHCEGIRAALAKGKAGEVYNFGADCEWRNLDLVKALLRAVGRPEDLIAFVTDRPGHDLRYAIDSTKSRRELGWGPRRSFEEGLRATVEWYVARAGHHG